MVTARDTLIELLTTADTQRNDWEQSTYEAQADALLAAGWRAPSVAQRTAVVPGQEWDIGDPEPEGVSVVVDDFGDDDPDSPRWARTAIGDWKGYKNTHKCYLTWPELVRRWGPVRRVD